MKKAIVISCSKGFYNLGAEKLAAWLSSQGYEVKYEDGDPALFVYGNDLVCLSVIFSWGAVLARDIALRVKDSTQVWAGGPGLFALQQWWYQETGFTCQQGIDPRFEMQQGAYRIVLC